MANNYYELQYTGNKVIQWKNFTDTSTPLSAANLQKSHQAIDDMDQAVNAAFRSVDNTKLDKTLAGSMLIGVTYNDETGQMVFKHYDNSIPDITFNTNLQKLVVNFSYDPETQKLILTQADGSTVRVDLSAFVANPDLENSDTISWTINQDGSISANVKNGSITDAMLESGYLAQVTAKASAAAASATNADYYSKLSKSYANGTSNLSDRPNENVDNSKYFKQESEAWAVGTKDGTAVPSTAPQHHNNSKYWAEQAAQSSGAVDMRGATSTTAGAHGLAPAPAAGDNTKFLRGDGTWAPASADVNDFTGATSSSDGTHGLVPAPQAGDEGKALMGDGTWDYAGELSWTGTLAQWNALSSSEKAEYDGKKIYITDDYMQNIPVMTGASASDGGYKGLVPTPQSGDQDKTLKGDGTWGHKLVTDIVTQNGAYGYIGANNVFIPFKSQADINAAVLAATIKAAALTQVETNTTDTITLSSLLANTYYFLFVTFSYLAKPSDMQAIDMIEISGNYTLFNRSNIYHEKPFNYVQNSSTRIYVMSICFFGKTGESGNVVFKIANGVTMPSEYNFKVKGFRVYTDLQ